MSSSSRIFRSLTLTLAILFAACSPDPLPSATPPPESAPPSHFVDVRDSPSADGTASLTASVRVAIDFPNQLAPTYRRHFTGGATPIQRGTLVLELCEEGREHALPLAVRKLGALRTSVRLLYTLRPP